MLKTLYYFYLMPLFTIVTVIQVIVSILFLVSPELMSRKLNVVSSQKYIMAKKLSDNPSFTKTEPEYFVTYNPSILVMSRTAMVFKNNIFITRLRLNDEYLDVILAHELGHIQTNNMMSDCEVDRFAAKILGLGRLKSAILYHNYNVENRLKCLGLAVR